MNPSQESEFCGLSRQTPKRSITLPILFLSVLASYCDVLIDCGPYLVFFGAIVCIDKGYSKPYVIAGFIGAIAVFGIFVEPALKSCRATLHLRCDPPAWPKPLQSPAACRPFGRPNWLSIFVAHPAHIYLGALWLGKYVGIKMWSKGETFAAALLFGAFPMAFHRALIIFQNRASRRVKILFFWKYNEPNATALRRWINPVLAAFGEVTVIDNDSRRTLASARAALPNVPTGFLAIKYLSTNQWRDPAKKLIAESDLVVVDVTDLSDCVAWEIAQSLHAAAHPHVVLIARVDYLLSNPQLAEELQAKLAKYVAPDSAKEILARLPAPIPYSTDLANTVFVVRFFGALRDVAFLSNETSARMKSIQ